MDTKDPTWVDQVLKATDGAGVDLIVDQVSGGVANDNLRATKYEGRIVNVGRLGGMTGEFDFDLHALRRINYIGVTFRTRTLDGNPRDHHRGEERHLGRGRVRQAQPADRQGVSVRCRPTTPTRT